MKTQIGQVDKQQLPGLISALSRDKLSKDDLATLSKWVLVSSAVYSGSWEGQLCCLWGLIPPTLLSEQAYLWLHTTEAASEHEFVLVRRSQIEVRKMLEEHPRIIGHCEVGAERSIRWLGWLGAIFGEPQEKLIPFVIKRKEWPVH